MRHITFFEVVLALFAISVPIGVTLVIVGPFEFFQAMGTAIIAMAAMGLWIAASGLRLVHPQRWAELTAPLRRGGPSPADHVRAAPR